MYALAKRAYLDPRQPTGQYSLRAVEDPMPKSSPTKIVGVISPDLGLLLLPLAPDTNWARDR